MNHRLLLLDNASAAEMLSISPRTLVKLREGGELPFVRLQDGTKGIRYSLAALEEWIAQRQTTTPKRKHLETQAE
jgi:excisionase family DNA binding protein